MRLYKALSTSVFEEARRLPIWFLLLSILKLWYVHAYNEAEVSSATLMTTSPEQDVSSWVTSASLPNWSSRISGFDMFILSVLWACVASIRRIYSKDLEANKIWDILKLWIPFSKLMWWWSWWWWWWRWWWWWWCWWWWCGGDGGGGDDDDDDEDDGDDNDDD